MTASNLLDSLEVRISVIQDRFTREDCISPGWDDRCCSSFSSRFIDFTTVIPTIRSDAFYWVRHLVEKTWLIRAENQGFRSNNGLAFAEF